VETIDRNRPARFQNPRNAANTRNARDGKTIGENCWDISARRSRLAVAFARKQARAEGRVSMQMKGLTLVVED